MGEPQESRVPSARSRRLGERTALTLSNLLPSRVFRSIRHDLVDGQVAPRGVEAGPVFLALRAVKPGIGIPGFPHQSSATARLPSPPACRARAARPCDPVA